MYLSTEFFLYFYNADCEFISSSMECSDSTSVSVDVSVGDDGEFIRMHTCILLCITNPLAKCKAVVLIPLSLDY